ncbi:MAG: hypothetical protein MI892_28860 [Desulfobacterales bacterium]|nr:hypothetical protein [Desulfobacterales bacterium]
MILESLDIMISLGVIFLVLSMVQKYVMSLFKRSLKTKAKVVSKEMKVFIGEYTSQYLELYAKKKSKHLNLLEKNRMIGSSKGLRLLSPNELKEVTNELKEYLEGKTPDQIKRDLGQTEITTDMVDKLEQVKTHLKLLPTKIETVYDNTLRKIEEDYTHNMRRWTFYIALILTVIINANFFDIYKNISTNSLVRDKLVHNADEVMDRLKKVENDIASKFIDQEAKIDIQEEIEDVKKKISSITGSLPENSNYFGWADGDFYAMFKSAPTFFSKVCGFIISALLISFGAPFWHDYLKTFIGIRKVVAGGKDKNENTNTTPSTSENVSKLP